jgi:hypothetical protein
MSTKSRLDGLSKSLAKAGLPAGRYTPVTDHIRREIKLAIAREGGLAQFEQVTGIRARSAIRVMEENLFVSEIWMDKFCCLAHTDMWITDFEWFSQSELKKNGKWKMNTEYLQKGIYDKRDGNGKFAA